MSNIFYSNVDFNLRKELNARGLSGFTRRTADLDFMLGKIANVELIAYDSGSSKSKESGRLGGRSVREGRFLPNGPDGFLQNSTYTTSSIVYSYSGDTVVSAKLETSAKFTDTTNRVGPFLTSVDVTIGDHSMGLLNKATVNLVIPNPQRDLDNIEEVWFRPGRYVKIQIHHPESAIITKNETDGRLTANTLPNTASLKSRYPDWKIDDLLAEINRMNVFSFEGLITSFDFSYTDSGQVEASLSLTGTSNSYTDVSMYMPSTDEQTDPKKPASKYNPKQQSLVPDTEANQTEVPKSEFYDVLNNNIIKFVKQYDPEEKNTLLLQLETSKFSNSSYTDHFILVGEPYPPSVNDRAVEKERARIENSILSGQISGSMTASMMEQANYFATSSKQETDPRTHYNRYITLGALIYFTNSYITSKIKSTEFTEIICTDNICYSNYLPNLTSCTPDSILLLPEYDNPGDMNHYGDVVYYQDVSKKPTNSLNDDLAEKLAKPWPGVYTKNKTQSAVYPSRIFINIELIQSILTSISANNTKKYTVDTFLTAISGKINYATGGAINMHLVTHPKDQTKLLFTDIKYISSAVPDTENDVTNITKDTPVIPYSVPMMANHPNGTIVRSFNFSATIPDNVKNLSYVLNQGDEVTEQEIAPYMNFMYSSKDENQINKFIGDYKNRHELYIKQLTETKNKLGLSPTEPQLIQGLYKALNNYIKYPTPDIKKSQIMVAPIFPFTVEFEIDGINGLRYGDVLTFDMLPLKYRVNTVFSIIGITHTVSTEGQWTTSVRCIMRPKID